VQQSSGSAGATVLVTGGSLGIGARTAEACAEQGPGLPPGTPCVGWGPRGRGPRRGRPRHRMTGRQPNWATPVAKEVSHTGRA
jgi:hypothetical protein